MNTIMERTRKNRTHSIAPHMSKQKHMSEIEDLFANLNLSIRSKNEPLHNHTTTEKSNQLLESLIILKEKIKTLDSTEKNHCITHYGGITILIQCLCYCGKNSIKNDVIIEICQQLIDNSHDSSRLFCKQIISHLYNDIECIGISDVLTKIIHFYPLSSIFIEDLCIPKLLEIYYKCSLALSNIKFKVDPTIYINSAPLNSCSSIGNGNGNGSVGGTNNSTPRSGGANTANTANNTVLNGSGGNSSSASASSNSKDNNKKQPQHQQNIHEFHSIQIPICWSEDGTPPPPPQGYSFENLLTSVPTPKSQAAVARQNLILSPTSSSSSSTNSNSNNNVNTTPTISSITSPISASTITNNSNSINNTPILKTQPSSTTTTTTTTTTTNPTSIGQIQSLHYHNSNLYQTPPLFNRNRGNNTNDSTTSSPADSPLIHSSNNNVGQSNSTPTTTTTTPIINRIVPLLPLSNSINNINHVHPNNTPNSAGSNNGGMNSASSNKTKSLVPRLNLPVKTESSTRNTRSSRRRDETTNSTRSQTQQIETNATKELNDLAIKLGETYMTADLTALISYKQAIESHKQSSKRSIPSKRYEVPPLKNITNSSTTTSTTTSVTNTFSESNLYKVRCNILKTLISSTSNNLMLLQYGNNPINILYSESILLHKGIIPSDRNHLNLFYKLASHWSDYVEYIHRNRWRDVTKGMSLERKASFRKKLDLLLWRINSSISSMLDTFIFDDMEYQLCVLSEYMENCPSRIISSQVVDVCIESLLKVKHNFFRGQITAERIKDIHIVHYLLTVFDEIIKQNRHPPLNDLFINIFLERDETFQFIKQYTIAILTSESIEREFTKCYSQDTTNKTRLNEFRCRAIKHFSICVKMLKFKYNQQQKENDHNNNSTGNSNSGNQVTTPNSSSTSNNTTNPATTNTTSSSSTTNTTASSSTSTSTANDNEISDLLKKMEFLLLPQSNGGIILPFLQSSSFFIQFNLKKQMLKFLNHVFLFKKNPFTKKKLYIDSYISYIYISFIKFYNNYVFDQATLTLCRLFLNILISFSINKNDKISMKFYQLRTMDFLVREVNLEFEIKQNKDQFLKPLSSIPFFSNSDNDSNDSSNTPPIAITTVPPVATTIKNEPFTKPHPFSAASKLYLGLNLSSIKNNDSSSSTGNTTTTVSTEPTPALPTKPSMKFSLNLSSISKTNPTSTSNSNLTSTTATTVQTDPTPSTTTTKPIIPPISMKPLNLSLLGKTNPASTSTSNLTTSTATTTVQTDPTPSTTITSAATTAPTTTVSTEPTPALPTKPPMKFSLNLSSISKTNPTSTSSSNLTSTTATTVQTDPTPSTTTTKPIIPPISMKPLNLSLLGKTNPASTSTSNLTDPTPSTTTTTTITNSKPPIIPKLTLPAIKLKREDEDISKQQQIGGVLTSIEQKIDPQDPKFQLLLDNPLQTLTPSGDRDSEQSTSEPTENEIFNENQRYQLERNNRKLYHDRDLHISLLQLIFSLLLNSNQTLEHLYSDQFPIVAKKLNVPFILHLHINHQDNEKIIPELTKRTHEMGSNHFRILKLLFSRLYHSTLFKDLKRVAKGAYGTVYKGTLGNDEGLEIAVKLMPVPKTIHDRCVLYDIFTEILIMDTFRSDSRGCHMFDYGVDGENYWIVMKSYKCSLKEWRLKQTSPFLDLLPLLLNIFTNVLLSVQFLGDHKINHFDIKCDNFLVHPLKKGTIEEDFWNQPTVDPNFAVCLADWGEAKVYTQDVEGYTTRNRGTEFIKSPEMLTIAYASQKTRENFDRRKKVGSNTASDVWSLGCLFYELLTGDFLFYDDDWVKFFIRVTQPGQELITPERKSKVANIPAILDFLDYVFIRDPFYRPTLRDLLTKFTAIKPTILAQYEQLKEKQQQDNRLANSINGTSSTSTTSTLPPKQYYNGGDGTRYKGKNTKITGHYTPGRFLPHSYNATNSNQPLKVGSLMSFDNNTGSSTTGSSTNKKLVVEQEGIPYEMAEFPEHIFFMDRPTKIAPFMYISSFNPSMNKNMLINEFQITHIINCTGSPNAFPDHFEYLHLQLHDLPSQDILQSLSLAFDFIRDAIVHHGKVLICSDKGVSRSSALAIGYFMDSRSISYFEAFIMIRDCRYIISPNPGFVEQLCRWGKQRRNFKGLAEWGGGESNSTQFQCLCGACSLTLLTPFESSNTRKCNCTIGSDSNCPNTFIGCINFLNDMKKLHGYNFKYLNWGNTNIINVVGDYERSSIEIKLNSNKSNNNNNDWNLYKCKFCHFLTYAISKSTGVNENLIALVTNQRSSYFSTTLLKK